MATIEIPISSFSLNSTWTAKLTPSVPVTPYITPNPPTVGSRQVQINLAGIPAGSTINTAVLSATLGSAVTGVRLSTVDFNGSGNVTFSGSLNVKPYISAFGTVPLLFRFGANGSTSGATVEGVPKYSTLSYSTVKVTINYTPPTPPDPEDPPPPVTYTKCGAPTSVLPQASAIKGATVPVTFSGASDGDNNPITGYKIYRGASPTGTFYFLAEMASTAASGSFNVVAPATAGTTYYYKIQTLGTQTGYDSVYSTAYASITATEPPAPADLPSTLSLNKTTCKAGAGIRAAFGVKTAGATHRVQYISGTTATYADLTDIEHVFVVPLNWQNQIPNATTLSVRVVLSTYKGLPQNSSTFIGSVEKTFTMTLSDDAYPSIGSMGTTRVANGVPAAITRHVQNKTKCYVAILDAQGAYGSTITNYTVTGNGQTFNNSSGTFGVFPTAGTVTFTGTVKDSRGRTRTVTISIVVDAYATPTLLNPFAYRSNSSGVADGSGAYAYLKATTVFSSIGGENTATLRGRYGIRGGSYGAWQAMTSGTGLLIGGTLLVTKSYSVQIQVTDLLGGVYTYTTTIPTEDVSFNIRDGGLGAAFGKYAETDGLLEVAYDVRVNGAFRCLVRKPTYITTGDMNTQDEEWILAHPNVGNIPTGAGYWYVQTIAYGTSNKMQVAYAYTTSNQVWWRRMSSGTWTAWVQIK